jgi:bifunctional non-homologous end joining protein LigD
LHFEFCILNSMIHTCVIGGWTDPRGSRPFFGALLLGVCDGRGELQYVGQTGAGFTDAQLGRVWKQLHALRTRTCPFTAVPHIAGRAHWVKPKLVVEVTSTGWTRSGTLRRPVFVGLKTDAKRERTHNEHLSIAADSTRPD